MSFPVQSMNMNTKKNDPTVSDMIEVKDLKFPELSIVGTTNSEWPFKKRTKIADRSPPIICATMYITPRILLEPKLEFFLSMQASVTAGLK